MTTTYNVRNARFVPYFHERDDAKHTSITDLLYTATNDWLSEGGWPVYGEWRFGLSAAGEYLAEKIENGATVRTKVLPNRYQLQSLLTWYAQKAWTINTHG
jgi:hypothetical protein